MGGGGGGLKGSSSNAALQATGAPSYMYTTDTATDTAATAATTATSIDVPAVTQAPSVPDTSASDAALKAENLRAQKALLLMKGRKSTILTDSSTLGTPNVGKRVLLGA